ncbi:hypothetical protein PV367_14540, partial [Streptomyces europaeiscabiei]
MAGWGQRAAGTAQRIFANQLAPALPNPPTGSLAGVPNVELQDSSPGGLPADYKPMFCCVTRPHRLVVDERGGPQLPPGDDHLRCDGIGLARGKSSVASSTATVLVLSAGQFSGAVSASFVVADAGLVLAS